MVAQERQGRVIDEDGEPVRSVRLQDKCYHPRTAWRPSSCGHCHCSLCDGFVHPGTHVVMLGAGGIIQCNRLWHRLESYDSSW